MEKSLNIERRAADRLIYQAGVPQSRVDKAREPKPRWLEQYGMEMAALGLVVLGVVAIACGGINTRWEQRATGDRGLTPPPQHRPPLAFAMASANAPGLGLSSAWC